MEKNDVIYQSESITIDLFGGVCLPYKKKAEVKRKSRYLYNKQFFDITSISTPFNISENNILPYHPCNRYVPSGLISFNECLNSTDFRKTVHFYIFDHQFARLLRNPDKYFEQLKKYQSVIATDFSLKVGMSARGVALSLSANRILAEIMYTQGINVIPNVQWCTPEYYDIPGEDKSRSIYYPNERLDRLRRA